MGNDVKVRNESAADVLRRLSEKRKPAAVQAFTEKRVRGPALARRGNRPKGRNTHVTQKRGFDA